MLWPGIADNMVHELETMHCRPPKKARGETRMTWYEICSMVNHHDWRRGLQTKLLQTGRTTVIMRDYKYGHPSWSTCWSIIGSTVRCWIHDDLSLVIWQSIVITNEAIHHCWYCALPPQSVWWDIIDPVSLYVGLYWQHGVLLLEHMASSLSALIIRVRETPWSITRSTCCHNSRFTP